MALIGCQTIFGQAEKAQASSSVRRSVMVPKESFSVVTSPDEETTIKLHASSDNWVTLEVRNAEGDVLFEQAMAIERGNNEIPLFLAEGLQKGNYTAVLRIENRLLFAKFSKS